MFASSAALPHPETDRARLYLGLALAMGVLALVAASVAVAVVLRSNDAPSSEPARAVAAHPAPTQPPPETAVISPATAEPTPAGSTTGAHAAPAPEEPALEDDASQADPTPQADPAPEPAPEPETQREPQPVAKKTNKTASSRPPLEPNWKLHARRITGTARSRCGDKFPAGQLVSVALDVSPAGHALAAFRNSGTPGGRCLSAVVEGHSFGRSRRGGKRTITVAF